jgi:hypothetical protein
MENSAVDGGAVWDDQNLLAIMEALQGFVERPSMIDQGFPLQLPEIVNELDMILGMYELSTSLLQQISEKILELHWSGCQCPASCDQYCPCYITGSICTPWCGRHQSSSAWDCMTVRTGSPMLQSFDATTEGY